MIRADEPAHDGHIAELLRLAGRRPSPGADRMRQARDAAHGEWTRARHARGRRRLAVAVAVALGAIVGGAWLWTNHPSSSADRPELATLRTVAGSVRIIDPSDRPVDAGPAGKGRRLAAGDRIEMGEGSRAAFELVDGTSVRMAGATLVTLDSDNRLELARGTIYVDSNPVLRPNTTRVETPFGTISHVGTQFELRLLPDSLSVRVREGEVVVESRETKLSSRAGEALLLARNTPPRRTPISTSDAEWAWVATLAAPFALEGSTVSAFLRWASREQGWRWEYADADARRLAERAVLHGSIEGMTPEDALLAVLPASGLTSARDGDRLIVSALR